MRNKEHVQRALGITAEEHSIAVEQAGYQWIDRYFSGDADMIRIISTCAMFWKWWVNQWDIRDAEFVSTTSIDLIDTPLEGRYWQAAFEEWLDLHNVMKLKIIPNRWVIQALSKMIAREEAALETLIKK